MSTSSDNANIKDLVDPLKIMSKSLVNNDRFKEMKEFMASFTNKLNEYQRNDEKLTNYRQFFSEIDALDKRLANLAESSDLLKLDTLIELEKTNALITTGILKTTLEIKELLSNVSFNNRSLKEKASYSDNLIESATHAKAAYDLARLFNVSEGKSRAIAFLVGGTSFTNSMADSGSNKLNETFDDIGATETIASLASMIPNPYIKGASYAVLSGVMLDRLFERYFPDERQATIEFVRQENIRTVDKEIEESQRILEKWRSLWKGLSDLKEREGLRIADKAIEESSRSIERWKAFGDFLTGIGNGLLDFKQSESLRIADKAIEDSRRAIDKWTTFGDFWAGIGNGLLDFKQSESLRIADKAIEESSRSIARWKAIGNFFSEMWNGDNQFAGIDEVLPNSYLPLNGLAASNSYNFTHTPNIVINVAAGTPEEIVNGVRNAVNSAALDLERQTIQILNGGQ